MGDRCSTCSSDDDKYCSFQWLLASCIDEIHALALNAYEHRSIEHCEDGLIFIRFQDHKSVENIDIVSCTLFSMACKQLPFSHSHSIMAHNGGFKR